MVKILAISGSLRVASVNSAVLRSAAVLAPKGVEISVYQGLGDLPLFNPDLEGFEPFSVLDFRNQLKASDGVLISSPEYAHGITGVLKNALDWIVGSGELVDKPVALLSVSLRAKHAPAALEEVIKTMDSRLLKNGSITIPISDNRMDQAGILAHKELSVLLYNTIITFACGIHPQTCSSLSYLDQEQFL